MVAGVPPDYFSKTGQLWGNPLYNWEVMAFHGYGWWIERMKSALDLYDRCGSIISGIRGLLGGAGD